MSRFLNPNNQIWNRHNLVITLSILSLFITLPLSILLVATNKEPADIRSLAKNMPPIDPTNSPYHAHRRLPSRTPNLTSSPTLLVNPVCRADFNNNGDIDIYDLQVIVDEAQRDCSLDPAQNPTCLADFNENGVIDNKDLESIISDAQKNCKDLN